MYVMISSVSNPSVSFIYAYRVYRLYDSYSYSPVDSVVSSDARLHVHPIHFLARRAVC